VRAVRTRVVSAPALFALLPVLGVRPPCLWFRPPIVVRVRVLLCFDLCHMSPPGLRPRAAASAVPPVALPAGSPVDPAAAHLSGLSPAAAPFSPASTAFPQCETPAVKRPAGNGCSYYPTYMYIEGRQSAICSLQYENRSIDSSNITNIYVYILIGKIKIEEQLNREYKYK